MSNIRFDYVERLEVDSGEVFEAIRKDYSPEDVFGADELGQWATENGYVEETT